MKTMVGQRNSSAGRREKYQTVTLDISASEVFKILNRPVKC